MELQWVKNALEALLFACGEPVSTAQLAQALELDSETVQRVLDDMQQMYAGADRGLVLLRLEDRWQLASKPEFAGHVKKVLDNRRNTPLSPAALEALAIIAYNQPVSRSFIDQVRGVDSASAVQTLQARGLIEEAGRLDLPGHPVSFATTDTFLRCFGLSRLDQLPPLHEEVPEAMDEEQADELLADADALAARPPEDMVPSEDGAPQEPLPEDAASSEGVAPSEDAAPSEDGAQRRESLTESAVEPPQD